MSCRSLSRTERWTIGTLAAASLLLRAAAYFRYRFDSDEPQHLHVTWGWTAGLVQYRDVFDNHAPLFHIATSPVLALVGERADVLLYMRAPMLLIWAAVLLISFRTARALFPIRVAAWSTLLLACFPPFFLKSLEYRTDNAWALACVAAVALHLRSRLRSDRVAGRSSGSPAAAGCHPPRPGSAAESFAIGLLLGLALGISLKTPLVVIALVLTEIGLASAKSPGLARSLGWMFAGFAIPPAAIAAFFAALGALPDLVYCVFEFNTLIAQTHQQRADTRWLYPLVVIVLLATARRARARAGEDPLALARLRVFFITISFGLTLAVVWTLISPRDALPVMPWGAILLVAALDRPAMPPAVRTAALAATAAGFLFAVLHYADRLENRTDEHITMMRQVLALTRPGELVMDHKGETIYRHRPSYYIFERITRQAMASGLLRDTVAEDVVRARCTVAQADGPFLPPGSRAFLSRHFMDLGRLRAAGQWIDKDGSFTIAIPARYAVVTRKGRAAGLLDGMPYNGPAVLTAGTHRFVASEAERAAVIWAPAFERGFSPFHLKDRDF